MSKLNQDRYILPIYLAIMIAWFSLCDITTSYAAPLPPTSLSVSDVPADQGGALKLTWVPSVSKEVLRQRVYRSTTMGGPYTLVTEISNNITNNFTDGGLTNGTTYYYVVRSSSGVQSTFTDDSIVASQTLVKSQHYIELRQAIDTLRTTIGLSVPSWTDSSLSGLTVRTVHLQEMRSRLSEALTTLGLQAPAFTDPDLTTTPVVIRKIHVDELRQWLKVEESANSSEANAVPIENLGSIAGKVTRSDGVTALAGAAIKLSQGGVDKGSATAAADGSYLFNNLSSGIYDVACSATGFLPQSISINPAGQTATVNCPLQDANGIAFFNYDETGVDFGKGIGRLTSVIDATGNKMTLEYDQRGQVITQKRTIDGDPYIFTNTYDALGRAETITYPDSSVARYSYTNNGLLDKVYDPSAPVGALPYAQYTGYNALGQPSKITYGNGVTTDYVYKPDNFRIHSIFTSYSTAGQCFQSMTYNYDLIGNVKEINDYRDPGTGGCSSSVVSSNSQQFDYDSLNRLVAAHGPYGTNGTLVYDYNEIGNMICNTELGACVQQPGDSVPTNYSYPASGAGSVRPHAVTQAGSNSYLYDLNGNMKSGAGRTIDYSQDNRPAKVTIGASIVDFVYDANGTRVEKIFTDNSITPPITTTNIYVSSLYECKRTMGVVGISCTKYIFAGDQRIALKDSTSTLYFHSDHLGSAGVITDSIKNPDGTVPIAQILYYLPFGKTRSGSNPNGGVHYQYTDQENDFETGLYNYGARLYDPAIARFISPDWIVQSMRNPQFLNRYSYTVNNPLRYIDPSGNLTVDDMGPDLTCNLCNQPLNPPRDPEPPRGLNLGDDTNLNCSLCPNTPSASTSLDDRFGTGGIGVHAGGVGPGFPAFSSGNGGRGGGNSGGGTVSNWLTGGTVVGGITTTFTSMYTPTISIPSLTAVGAQALNLITTGAEVILSIPQSVSIPAVVMYIWRPIPAGEGSDVVPNTYFAEGDVKVSDLKRLPDRIIDQYGGEEWTSVLKDKSGRSKSDLYWNPKTGDIYTVPKKGGGPPENVGNIPPRK